MVGLPTYDPGGTKLTEAAQANPVSADMFGGTAARATAGLGQTLETAGGKLMDMEAQQKGLDDAAAVTDAYGEAQTRMRQAQFGPGGLFERTGKNADGVTDMTVKTADEIYADVSKKFSDPKQQAAFKQMWTRYSDGAANAATDFEFKQRGETRKAATAATLGSITDDVIANYNDPKMLATNFDAAKAIIRANSAGLPDEAVKQTEAETLSSLNVAVIQRLAQDSPGKALDYYEAHKGEVVGTDHATVHQMISGVQNVRAAQQAVQEVSDGTVGGANKLVRAVITSESAGDAGTPDSPTGAAGLMQLQPDTARELASTMPGMGNLASMTDKQLSAYWRTPEGQKANIRLGTNYLAKQMKTFNGDMEAALIAYNAGPANATKFLNAGRDYSALPKPQETLPYVKKTLSTYLGVNIAGNSSDEIQQAVKGYGQQYYRGDAPTLLKTKLQSGHGPEYVDNMQPALQTRLASMFSEAPDFVKAGMDLMSGARTHERQTQLWNAAVAKYGSPAAARKWVAPPEGTVIDGKVAGGSQHEHGSAADLGWKGGSFDGAPPEVIKWAHDNAQRFGLKFPLSNESWHVEPQETRDGGKGDRLTAGDVQRGDQGNIANRFAQQPPAPPPGGPTPPPPSTVAVDTPPPSAADIYTKSVAPFSASGAKDDLASQLTDARERYADNPSLLAEVERQLTDKSQAQIAAAKADQDAAQLDVFKTLMQGGKVADTDQSVLLRAGPENVAKLLTMEGKIGKMNNPDDTDEPTYYKLSQDPNFANVNLLDYADKLSKADLKELADKQAVLKRGSASARATDMTRTQIIGNAADVMGLKPNERPADAVKLGGLNRALNTQIDAYTEANKKDPDGPTIQKMVDDLMMQGHIKKDWASDPEARVFELAPADKANFYVTDDFNAIPADALPKVASGFKSIWQRDPDKGAAVDFYNDMVRVQLGAAPTPPPDLDTVIRQRLAKVLNTTPSTEQVANYYKQLILKSSAAK